MLWFDWRYIAFSVAVLALLWCSLRTYFVSLRLATMATVLNNLLVCVAANAIVATAFFLAGAFQDGFVALLWPLVAEFISRICPDGGAADIERKLWRDWRNSSVG